ncbi:MAG TPA: hypothetical protein VGT61_12795 [Thermomicrobiales bacterium]|jgi:hypothetical protein|nr:hypothetical protein [Thermomicrobiales bacterium]
MQDVSAQRPAARTANGDQPVTPRVIAPHVPTSRDIVSLYATRIQHTGADVLPALRQRRASFPTGSESNVGYLAVPVPRVSTPLPVGRGTSTHRQALDAMAASQWATQIGWLPDPEPVRVTRTGGAIHRANRPGLVARVGAALSAFARPSARSAAGYEPSHRFETSHRLETQTA